MEEGGTSIRILQEASRAELVQRAPAFLDGERTAVSVDVDVERCSPRYHETSLALESIEERGSDVSKTTLHCFHALPSSLQSSRDIIPGLFLDDALSRVDRDSNLILTFTLCVM